jgi:uncharacterized membrane protein YhhN
LPSGAELTGQFTFRPAVKASTAVLLAVAALIPLVSRSGPRLLAEGMGVPVRWAYAASLVVLITAGFFFGRTSVSSARPAA